MALVRWKGSRLLPRFGRFDQLCLCTIYEYHYDLALYLPLQSMSGIARSEKYGIFSVAKHSRQLVVARYP